MKWLLASILLQPVAFDAFTPEMKFTALWDRTIPTQSKVFIKAIVSSLQKMEKTPVSRYHLSSPERNELGSELSEFCKKPFPIGFSPGGLALVHVD